MFVPVVERISSHLCPPPHAHAGGSESGKATAFWKGGVFCVRLNQEPSAAIPSPSPSASIRAARRKRWWSNLPRTPTSTSRRCGHLGQRVGNDRHQRRRARRFRTTPCRPPRCNRARGGCLPRPCPLAVEAEAVHLAVPPLSDHHLRGGGHQSRDQEQASLGRALFSSRSGQVRVL